MNKRGRILALICLWTTSNSTYKTISIVLFSSLIWYKYSSRPLTTRILKFKDPLPNINLVSWVLSPSQYLFPRITIVQQCERTTHPILNQQTSYSTIIEILYNHRETKSLIISQLYQAWSRSRSKTLWVITGFQTWKTRSEIT